MIDICKTRRRVCGGFRGTTIQRMKSNELSRVLRLATTLRVPMGSYYGDLEAYTASQGLVLENKEARFCCLIFVQNPVVPLF
jgi:hypothetical protein